MEYKNILWCPIDLPKFPYVNSVEKTDKSWDLWEFFRITEKRNSPYEISNFTQEVEETMPLLVSWIKLFPYKTIRNIKINYQIGEVPTHIDFTKPDYAPELHKNNSENEPCGYRVLICGNRTNGLYIEKNNKKIYTVMPDETDVYVLGHTDTPHGVNYEPNRNTMFMHFEIDKDRHNQLLAKSYDKYKKYAILNSDFE